MNDEVLNKLYGQMSSVHDKAESVFNTSKLSTMLQNEYKNKVSQYNEMYDSLEEMKSLTTNEEALENLINQQIEVLRTRIKWQVDWVGRAIDYNKGKNELV